MTLLRRGLIALAAAILATSALASGLPTASPEEVGLSADRLARLERAMQAEVDAGRKAGIVTLVARRGRIAHLRAYGMADIESGKKMQTDHLFRLYSLTKPITSVALLILYEEGKFRLTDPLAMHLPAFANVKVLAGTDASGKPILEDPKRPITIQDVFRHTAGFVYAFGDTPVDRAYREAGIDFAKLGSLRDLADKLAQQPLLYHPGERWVYSVAHDLQAYLVEHFSGMPFDEFCRQRIFEPLGMKDTFFGIPKDRVARYTTNYGPDERGRLQAIEKPGSASSSPFGSYARSTDIPFGGLGLSSTVTDYLRFAQMLVNGGELDGVRILGEKTVELMRTNHLPPGVAGPGPGYGYGLGVNVLESPAAAGNIVSKGAFGWAGAATTWATMDPEEDMVAIMFTQYMPMDAALADRFLTLVYQSVVER